MKGKINRYGKWKEVEIINICITPNIRMVREDLEYRLEQSNQYHIIYSDNGEIEDWETWYLSDVILL